MSTRCPQKTFPRELDVRYGSGLETSLNSEVLKARNHLFD